MAILLDPLPLELGVSAPILGPWFKPANVGTVITLPVPDDSGKLSVTIDLGNNGTAWLPPATGTLSLFIARPARPSPMIANLQDGNGDWPFEDGKLVAWFRLFPEVEERLHDLARLIPPATSAAAPAPPTVPFDTNQRARVRSFALVPTLPALDHDTLVTLFGGITNFSGTTNRGRMQALGLDIDNATGLVDGDFPMTRLRRPGRFKIDPALPAPQDELLGALAGSAQFWAFDHRGRAIDPGAVAAWWSWLMSTGVGAVNPGDPPQLLAPGINVIDLPNSGGQPLVCAVDAGRHAHLVDAHEGPLGDPFIDDRLRNGGTTVDRTLIAADGGSIAFDFKPLDTPPVAPPPDDPVLDNAPRARIAPLPAGPYATTLTLWPDGNPSTPGIERDFVRVAVVDEERHLVGISRRASRDAPADDNERRSSDQNRPSTRINVSRTASSGPVLLATAEEANAAIDTVFSTPGQRRAVFGIADAEAGVVTTPALLPTASTAFPTTLSEAAALDRPGTYRVRALVGGGDADGDQAVLVEIEIGPEFDGMWVRAWPLGFSLENGVRPRLTGGGGRVGGGRATLVMTLPAGRLDARGLLSFDAQLARLDANGDVQTRNYADLRFERPAPLPGNPASVVAGSWAICETGEIGNAALPAASVPPGATIVLLDSPPIVVDRKAVPAAARTAETLVNRLSSGDIISLTAPAFSATPDHADPLGRPFAEAANGGDPRGGLQSIGGVIVHRVERGGAAATASSAPFALQDRLEVAAAVTTSAPLASAVAALTGGPRLPSFHELLPHHLGHPGGRAAIETHATGVLLDGPPAKAIAEYVQERTSGLSFAIISGASDPELSVAAQSELAVAAEAATLLPSDPSGVDAGPVAAILRTTARGQEGIPGLALGAAAISAFPLSQNEAAFEAFLDDINLPGGAGPLGQFLRSIIGAQTDSVTRALDRRLLVGQHGARESAFALASAFDRAQDFIYIETPSLDALEHGPDDDRLNLLNRLIDRLAARKGLRVLICVPSRLAPGTPKKLQAIRDHLLLEAMDQLREGAQDRVALFSPGAGAGRDLRMATTTVIVDDVFAMTGTTHLSRRGLTFDSSLAATVFDERLEDGRPREIMLFRRSLIAGRLGVPASRLPDDPEELIRAVGELDEQETHYDFGIRPNTRRSVTVIKRPDPSPTTIDIATWFPDGSRSDLDIPALLAAVALTGTEHASPDE